MIRKTIFMYVMFLWMTVKLSGQFCSADWPPKLLCRNCKEDLREHSWRLCGKFSVLGWSAAAVWDTSFLHFRWGRFTLSACGAIFPAFKSADITRKALSAPSTMARLYRDSALILLQCKELYLVPLALSLSITHILLQVYRMLKSSPLSHERVHLILMVPMQGSMPLFSLVLLAETLFACKHQGTDHQDAHVNEAHSCGPRENKINVANCFND